MPGLSVHEFATSRDNPTEWILAEFGFTAQERGPGVLGHLAKVAQTAKELHTELGWKLEKAWLWSLCT